MGKREEYFARVQPLIGEGLRDKTIAVDSVSASARIIELLAACMLRRVVVGDPREAVRWPLMQLCRPVTPHDGETAAGLLRRYLAWKNGHVATQWLESGEPDLHVFTRELPRGTAPYVEWAAAARSVTCGCPEGDVWAFRNLSYTVARDARDILLGRRAWPEGKITLGSDHWPYAATTESARPPQQTSVNIDGAHIMIIGCGSIGSEVARLLAGHGARWTLVDGGDVSIYNPHRQWFSSGDVGRPKVKLLARQLRPEKARAVRQTLNAANIAAAQKLLDKDVPDLVLLTTGTSDDAALAELLWRRGIAHVVAYAYPQARYFEVSVIIPGTGGRQPTPCLHCLRGHLFCGVEDTAPMTDELASFLYREVAPEERERLYVNLVAEPATPIETGRIADVTALLATQVLASPELRAPWYERMLAESTTCLLGGNVAERRGEHAVYGITYPGQVIRLGLDDIAGAEDARTCHVCGRRLEVTHRVSLPEMPDAGVDAALLA